MSLGFRSFSWGLVLFFLGLIHEEPSRLPSGANEIFFFLLYAYQLLCFCETKKVIFWKIGIRAHEFVPSVCTDKTRKQRQIQFWFFFHLTHIYVKWNSNGLFTCGKWEASFLLSFHPSIPPSFSDLSKELSEIVFMIVYPVSSVVPLSFYSIISTR